MGPDDAEPRADPDSMSYEQAISELESIIEGIEQGRIGLQESLAEYRRGALLLRRCRAILDIAEQEVQELTAEPDLPPPPAGGAGP
jgi:exodeoxyribonuclease VII small subunit